MTAAAHAADRTRDLAGVAAAHRRLLAVVDRLDDDAARGPSLLPGWSVGHVLTHIARNADANAGVLAAAELGDVVPMYPSMEARNADIESGSSRRAADLVDDVRSSAARFEQQAAATGVEEPRDGDAAQVEGKKAVECEGCAASHGDR